MHRLLYSIVPPQFAVTNGMGSVSIAIQTANDVSQYSLAVTFSNNFVMGNAVIYTQAESVKANGTIPPILSAIVTELTSTEDIIPLEIYQDQNDINFTYPLPNTYPIVGGFGEWPGHAAVHWGIDLAAPPNTPVLAAKDGIVTFIGGIANKPSIGMANNQIITIDHGDGFATKYEHIIPNVINNQIVVAGQQIGVVGLQPYTGYGPHLHFAIMQADGSKPVWPYQRDTQNPYPLINPINLFGDFVFNPNNLWDGNNANVAVQAAMITKNNPETQIYNLYPNVGTYPQCRKNVTRTKHHGSLFFGSGNGPRELWE